MTLDGDLEVRWEVDDATHLRLRDVTLVVARPGLGDVEVAGRVWRSAGEGDIPGADLGGGANLERVVVHWVNVPTIWPAESLRTPDAEWHGRWRGEGAGWAFTFDSRVDLGDVVREIGQSRRFVVSHVAELRRADGATFGAVEASDALYSLQLALSFALGRWVAPALPVGFDEHGTRAWEQWAPWRCDRYAGFESWWDTLTHAGDDLRDFVHRFMDAHADPGTRDVVGLFAHHVIAANHGGTTVEARIMLTHAAAEYLAWVTLVLTGATSRTTFGRSSASEHLRSLLAAAHIPTAIPAELDVLSTFAASEGLDGPSALAWMRNRLVHPKDPGEPYRIQHLVAQAWQLGMHYCDLLLLHRLGYLGSYVPRFPPHRWAHDRQPVPWR